MIRKYMTLGASAALLIGVAPSAFGQNSASEETAMVRVVAQYVQDSIFAKAEEAYTVRFDARLAIGPRAEDRSQLADRRDSVEGVIRASIGGGDVRFEDVVKCTKQRCQLEGAEHFVLFSKPQIEDDQAHVNVVIYSQPGGTGDVFTTAMDFMLARSASGWIVRRVAISAT